MSHSTYQVIPRGGLSSLPTTTITQSQHHRLNQGSDSLCTTWWGSWRKDAAPRFLCVKGSRFSPYIKAAVVRRAGDEEKERRGRKKSEKEKIAWETSMYGGQGEGQRQIRPSATSKVSPVLNTNLSSYNTSPITLSHLILSLPLYIYYSFSYVIPLIL